MSIFRRGTIEVEKEEVRPQIKSPGVESGPGNGKIPSWEVGHADRAVWTKQLEFMLAGEFFAVHDSASDVEQVHPKYKRMTKADRVKVWLEFYSALSYFESSWIPFTESVDVGTQTNKNTWSVGLFQLSQVDQTNYGINLGYSYEDLKDPLKNINLAVRIMAKQIAKRGKIFIPKGENGVYWAVIHPGGKYDKTKQIQAFVAKVSFTDLEKEMNAADPTPWMTWMKRHEGEKEIAGKEDNAFIMSLYKYGNYPLEHDEVPWCAVCVNAALEINGHQGTRRADAVSFKKYGVACDLKYGAIVVLRHAAGNHHVTFFSHFVDNNTIACLGGNQNNALKVSNYNISGNQLGHDEILAVRWPIAHHKEIPMAFV